jgi:hypothetical protein
VRTLVPLAVHPADDPRPWAVVETLPPGTYAVISQPDDAGRPDPELFQAIARLIRAGVEPLGHLDLAHAVRPVTEVLDELTRWAAYAVTGVFLDRAPAGPFQLGPVALAQRMARRAGLRTVVLNPGVPVDPLYRDLDVRFCTFEGAWEEYVGWSTEGGEPGDGHLVLGVPEDQVERVRDLMVHRGAGFGLIGRGFRPAGRMRVPAVV